MKVIFTNRTFKQLLIVAVWLLLWFTAIPLGLYSQASGGGYSEAYLFRDVGSRPISMADAYTAIVNEPTAIFYNPAGLGFFVDKPMITTMWSFLGLGRTHAAIAWGQSINEDIGVGFGINSYSSGSFVGRDIKGNKLGDFEDWSYALVGAVSYKIESASVGIAMKYLSNVLSGSNTYANGYSVDIGMKIDVMEMFSFGAAVQNVSGMMFWNAPSEDSEMIPFSVRTGVAMEFGLNEDQYTTRSALDGRLETIYVPATRYILTGLDIIMTQHEKCPKVILGCEAVMHEMIAFRCGLGIYGEKEGHPQILPMNTWGGGISFRPNIEDLPFFTHIDYSLSSDRISQNGISHHISLMFEF